MHELSIAHSLIDGVESACEREGATRVIAVHVRIGALCGVATDALRFAWDVATDDTIVAGARLVIETVPGRELQLSAIELPIASSESQDHPVPK